jgi:hypothetical protein
MSQYQQRLDKEHALHTVESNTIMNTKLNNDSDANTRLAKYHRADHIRMDTCKNNKACYDNYDKNLILQIEILKDEYYTHIKSLLSDRKESELYYCYKCSKLRAAMNGQIWK